MRRSPELATWRDVGILSRRGSVLEAYDDTPSSRYYALRKLEAMPPEIKGSRLVLVAAKITPLTRRQCRYLTSSPP